MASAVESLLRFIIVALAAPVNATPSNTAECYDVLGITLGLSIIYDPGCPGQGLGCFEEYPCRYNACNTNTALDGAEEQWAGKCNTLAECQDACKDWAGCTAMNWWPRKGGCRLVKGATTSIATVWTTISGGVDCTVSSTQPVAPSDGMCAFSPSNTAECYDVPGINTALSIIYDPGCPGLGCFEEYPCRYNACNTNTALDGAEMQWAGQCNTLAECQDACKDWAGCTAMNWWPDSGGCRLVTGATTTSRTTQWTTISGGVDCTVSSTQPVAPSDSMCARRASCDCGCHDGRYAPDDRNDPPNDCWIPGFGYDLPCCPTPAPTSGTCADTDDGAADDDGDDCAGYTANPVWCSYHDDADFTSSDMCCACGGGEYQAVLFEQLSGDQKAQRNLRGTAPTPATTSAPPAVPDGYTMHAGMGSGPGYTADGGWIRISVMEGTTVLQCADACDQLPSCAGFTMLLDSNTCSLKSAVALTIPTDGINRDTYVKEAPTL